MRRGKPMRAVSNKRVRENRLRRKNLLAAFGPDPLCGYPDCNRYADDPHEILSRARGGSITDVSNIVPLCRPHHDLITREPLLAARIGLSTSRVGGGVHAGDSPVKRGHDSGARAAAAPSPTTGGAA